ncbi:cytochrome b [Paraburkholderia rhynchosiae]|uniref:Cytochrome B n=1 Tax=Paraburkholderia rhynchosiae TaxID=487049 RepID=A0A2N7WID2_9BURK|nr:cytochrome b [Paraburkholderia rhynchosiae]PMS29229.1 cytochrome B [Paraburkholderia rhynchosiae]CAB3744010.1 Cytochrome b561 [Paraburkholderia rhynchosiae]
MERRQYTSIAKILHWTMAIAIVCAWIAGYYSSTLNVAQKIQADSIMLHKSIATITLFLLAARIPWRLMHGAPEASCSVPSLERAAARVGHLFLYLCMLALPLSGWLWSSAAGYKIPVAGLFFLPPLMDKMPALAPIFKEVHICLAYTIAVLVCGHVLMALKHYFVDHSDSLESMLPSRLIRKHDDGERKQRSAAG